LAVEPEAQREQPHPEHELHPVGSPAVERVAEVLHNCGQPEHEPAAYIFLLTPPSAAYRPERTQEPPLGRRPPPDRASTVGRCGRKTLSECRGSRSSGWPRSVCPGWSRTIWDRSARPSTRCWC